MKIKPIKTEKDYQEGLKEIKKLWDAEPDTPKGDRLEIVMVLVESYENNHYPIDPPDPVEAIKFRMEQQGLKQNDLAEYLGGKSRVSEILHRKRQLTITMIRKLHKGLGIPLESLLAEAT